jgi:hypothetical protein
MLVVNKMPAQSSFGVDGFWAPQTKIGYTINSLESNPSNYSLLKDWGFSLSYGGDFGGNTTTSLYQLSLSKRIGEHFISVRYTPGYEKDFSFSNGQSIILQDSTTESLDSKFTYKELFGMGYSYRFSDKFSAGFSLRYFNQTFNEDGVFPVFSDTLYLIKQSQSYKANFWRGDLGINYSPNRFLSFSISSINLIDANDNAIASEIQQYLMKQNKAALLGFSTNPFGKFNFNLLYETDNAWQTGINQFTDLGSGSLGFGVTLFHDKFQTPYVAGIIPAISYSNNLFGVSISGVKYFSNRNLPQPLSIFQREGINNVINNRYSFDKAVLSVSFTLNTIAEQSVKFLDVEVLDEIYPTLSDNYLSYPFAKAKVINLTNHLVSVKPSSKIEGLNNDKIESPLVNIPPKDTVEIPFYTIIPSKYEKEKAGISYADFYLTTSQNNEDDKLQKPILINGINAWDGKVYNLRYFVKHDYEYSMNFAKEIVSKYKSELDTLSYVLSIFYKSKIIFNNLVKNLVYTSSPRSAQDYVQFPHETISLKGGNCDDLSVCYSSLLESVGIQTAFVDYKPINGIGHVNVLINTQLSPEQAKLITDNENKYIVRKNELGISEVWIPIETTSLTNFSTAWNLGAEKFNDDAINNLGIAKGLVQIVDVY